MNTKEKNSHLYGIDVLKTVAIFGVVCFHLFPDVFRGGFLGVCLFMVISGYLLVRQSNTMLKREQFHMETFYAKRLPVLYKEMYVMIVTTLAYMTLFSKEYLNGRIEELKSVFLGYNNWWQIKQETSYFARITNQSPYTHLWYMGIMIQVLLFWPIAVFLYKRIQKEASTLAANMMIIIVMLGSVIAMGYFYHTLGVTRAYYGTETRLFSFLIGVLCGLYDCKVKHRWKLHYILGTLLVCSGMVLTFVLYFYVEGTMQFLYYGGMAVLSIFFGILVLVVTKSAVAKAKWMRGPFFRFIGKYSYTIYLWHYPVIFFYKMWK